MPTLDELSAKVRNFYANIDPNKSQAEMDEVVMVAFTRGEEHVNANLVAKYGCDLNTFALPAIAHVVGGHGGQPTVMVAQPVAQPYYSGGQGVVLGGPGQYPNGTTQVITSANGQQVVVIKNTTPFASSPTYQYEADRQRQRNDDCCTILFACLATMLCLDCLF